MNGLWRSSARTAVGNVRHRNEDAVLDRPEHGVWAVADGLGGHQQGDLASRLVVEHLAVLPHCADLDERVSRAQDCLQRLNRHLTQELTLSAGQQPAVIGSTVVALFADAGRGICLWAGDSRCYLRRNGHLYQLSKDHSLAQQLVDQQQLSASAAADYPGAGGLLRAIGATPELQLERCEFAIYPGDALLLCSDGLYQELTQYELSAALQQPTPQQAVRLMFDAVLAGEARDNIGAVVIHR
ncbi:serine/threonine-protein phosphatase [Pseudomonas sp. UL073]|uniref:Serine/threonine-protein phosphatase n=1 Tax=Zestomonas insulae TaxID=2809017 RepID=A0ABS2IKW9_9GAMM|nr:PP2C family serine/threonine-protein phosphatase [Pseudomonas insulae]MBM7063375.1 serine/threonine-protein phosphatase [Pseudomonas insulae]